jgi:ATP-dependent Clp protease protease subunit
MIKTKISKHFKVRTVHDLLQAPIVINVNKFDEASVKEFKSAFQYAVDVEQPVIPIIIDSPGGYVYSLLAMVDILKTATVPIATVSLGKSMSCGAALLSCGTEGYRFAGPNSTIMIHDPSGGSHGNTKDMVVDAEEIQRLDSMLYKMMAQNCGRKDTYFSDIVHKKGHADWFLTAQQAKQHNLVNHIRLPALTVSASVKVTFE